MLPIHWLKNLCAGKYRSADHRGGTARNRSRLALEVLEDRTLLSGTWTPVTNPVPNGDAAQDSVLLSDGSIMVHGGGFNASKNWYKLTPDASGSYVNGTWTTLAPMHLERLDFPTALLPDGHVLVMGGEYSGPNTSQTETNTGEIYDPVSNTWTNVTNFPQASFGDGNLQLLPGGKVLGGYLFGTQTYIYDPATDKWTQTGSKLRGDANSEEGWVKLPDDSILSYDISSSPGTHAQRYVPSTGQWVDAGTLPVQLSGSSFSSELGPGLLLPDGRVIYFGANNKTAYYTPSTNSWTAGPNMPNGYGAGDEPGAVLPNGKVFIAVTDTTYFHQIRGVYQLDPGTNQYTDLNPATGGPDLTEPGFGYDALVLPSGQLWLSNRGSEIDIYTPDGSSDPAWQATISSVVPNGSAFTLTGTQLNGISGGAYYGDENHIGTNYPIVQLSNGLGGVTYARTFDWSSTGVATGSTPVSTQFTLPSSAVTSASLLSVIANGISSTPVPFVTIAAGDTLLLRLDPNDGSRLQAVQGGTVTAEFPLSSLPSITVFGSGGTLIVDESGGGIAAPITFQGNGSDSLIITGGPITNATLTYANQHDGSVTLDKHTINYTNLSALGSTATVANLELNYSPASTVTTTAAGAQTTSTSTAGLTTTFANPTTQLTITNNNVVNVNGLGSGPIGALTISSDTITVNAALTLGTSASQGGLDLTAPVIDLNGSSIGTAGAATFNGAVVLGTDVSIRSDLLGSTGDITFGGTVDASQPGRQGLTLAAGDNVSLLVAVGSPTPLASVSITTATLSAADIATTGGVTVNDSGAASITGAISGSGASLTKQGAGTLTLSGSSTYTGATTISGGELDVTGSITSNTTVNAGATLGGSGTITGTVSGAGTVSPGVGAGQAGILTIDGAFMPSGSVLFDVNAPYLSLGHDYDQIEVNDGPVNLSLATLLFQGGTAAAAANQQIPLIENNTTAKVVAGSKPADGSLVTLGSGLFQLKYNGGDGNDVVLTAKFSTSTTLKSSPNPSVFGQLVTVTATVTSAHGQPTGMVTFMDGSQTLGTATLNGGVATFTTRSLAAGPHSLTAVYAGGGNFATSTSPTVLQVVNKASTLTTLTSSANPSTYGAAVTFTARVTSPSAAATGMVTFMDGTTTLGTVPLTGGVATLTTSALSVGSQSITASYSDSNGNFQSSQASLAQTALVTIAGLKVSYSPQPSSGVPFTMTVKALNTLGVPITALAGQQGTLSLPLGSGVQLSGPLTAVFDSTGTLVFKGLRLTGKGTVTLKLVISNVDAPLSITLDLG